MDPAVVPMFRGAMQHFKTLILCLLSLPVLACGDPALNVRVSGSVTDAFGQPIEGATVRLSGAGGDRQTTTDVDGRYDFSVQRFGTMALDASAEGFASVRTTFGVSDVPDLERDFNAAVVRDLILYAADGTLRGRVLRSSGPTSPAAGLPIRIEYYTGNIRDAALPTEVVTEANGTYEVSGLPSSTNIRLYFPSFDADEDGVPETGARTRNIFMNPGSTTVWNETLSRFENPDPVWTNASGTVRSTTDDLEVFFNAPLETNASDREITLRQFSPFNFNVLTTSTIEDDGHLLRVTPVEPMTEGGSYQLSFFVTYTTGDTESRSYSFVVDSDAVDIGPPTDLRLADPGQLIDQGDTGFTVRFTLPQGADGYRIYNRVVGDETTDWVRAEEQTNPGGFTYDEFFFVPSVLRTEGSVFADGGTLEVAVTSLAGRIESPLSDPLSLRDGLCPTMTSGTGFVTGFGNWRNGSGSEAEEVAVQVNFIEWMASGTTPTLDIPVAGVDGQDFEFFWTSELSGRFEGTVPASTDVTSVTVDATDVTDASGNAICEGNETLTITVF